MVNVDLTSVATIQDFFDVEGQVRCIFIFLEAKIIKLSFVIYSQLLFYTSTLSYIHTSLTRLPLLVYSYIRYIF